MSKLNKYAQTEVVQKDLFSRDFEVSAKSLRYMNQALMQRIKEGVDLIAELKAGLTEFQKKYDEAVKELEKLKWDFTMAIEAEVKDFPHTKYGQTQSLQKGSGNPEERPRKVIPVSQAEGEE
jgi:paraquat-inducible protein B